MPQAFQPFLEAFKHSKNKRGSSSAGPVAFVASASQPADFTTANGNSASVDFAAGRPVVYAKQGFNPSAVSIVGAGAGASDVACTKVVGSAAGDFGIWVANANVSAGSYPVKVVAGGSATVNMFCGTLSNAATPLTPTSTAIKDPAGSYSYPTAVTSALTIPTNGVGILMGTSSGVTLGSNITTLYNSDTRGVIAKTTTAGSSTPTVTSGGSGSGFSAIAAASWG